ncbi:MAG: hypothetical protein AVDCRST_MAG39-2413 [uncultured Sphingomonadaceae bacterium]|uniref:Phosphatidic acid phosphatase type 2/haloperoxidase domain-containing protein n=1 Tax=uncultured Sphingomonadaceae bacterium TaxID=169976 RepID=A0A6J4T6N8_9SPHN|nr:MAG: hypothetical protein AVDCRST_MAG39-2413 [uncultured Sphingomonadaceae bacterium]
MLPTFKPVSMTHPRAAPLVGLALLWLACLLTGGAAAASDVVPMRLLHATDPGVRGALALLTHLGGYAALLGLTLAAAAWLGSRQRWGDVGLLLAVTLGGRLLIEGQKLLIARPRPLITEQLVVVWSKSFPSAHAGNSTVVYLTLALLLTRGRGGPAAAVALALAIGASRVALGVHWPTDVIGGWCFGALWVALAYSAAAGRLGSR